MLLKGSCHCKAVTFEVESKHPVPYQQCYCTICCKTGGGGGYVINLGADYRTIKIEGKENIAVYSAVLSRGPDGKPKDVSEGQRSFCKLCGSPLWMWDPRWPDLVHPLASAIDTELPVPPERAHIFLSSKPAWCLPSFGPNDKKFDEYPEESIEHWHKRTGMES